MNDMALKNIELMPIDEAKILKIVSDINLDDPSISVVYGAETMGEIAKFTDNLLSRVKAKDAGPIGQSLTDLMLQVKSIDVSAFGKKSIIERVPVIGSLFNSAKRTLAQFNTLSQQVDIISHKLEESIVGLIKDIQVLEQLFDFNKQYYDDLRVYIEAGRKKVELAREKDLPALQKIAEQSKDTMAAQTVRDYAEKINRFERRLHDLELSRTITVQTAPQIRIIQSNNQTLAEKIQTSILSTIPVWKGQIVLALSMQSQQSAAQIQKEVADTTNSLLKKNAEMLQTSSIETATQVERAIIDIETVRDVQGKLIKTIEETMRIAQEGRERRRSVENELAAMEDDLRVKLTSLADTEKKQAIHAAATKVIISE